MSWCVLSSSLKALLDGMVESIITTSMHGRGSDDRINMPPLIPDANRTNSDADTLAQIMQQLSLDVGYPWMQVAQQWGHFTLTVTLIAFPRVVFHPVVLVFHPVVLVVFYVTMLLSLLLPLAMLHLMAAALEVVLLRLLLVHEAVLLCLFLVYVVVVAMTTSDLKIL